MKIKPPLKFAAVVLLFATLVLSAFTIRANGTFLNGSSFIKGANLPWIDGDFYNDLAVNPHYPDWGCGYNSAHMNSYLADLHSMGITVVRFWLNTDDQGCTLDANGYVTGVTALFWTNLDNVVSLAGNNGISLYLTLSEGRFDWLTNSAMANAYKTNCLLPLIQRYKGNNRVFGIDLMNELDAWVADTQMGNPWISSGASWAQAQAYITNFASAVHSADSNRLVSCSQVYHSWTNLTYWKGLGLDFYDFHEYSDSISLPAASSLGMDKPIYIGECGQASGDSTWSDSLQSACELEALNSASSGGYAGVSIWAYQYPDWTLLPQYCMLNTNGSWRPVCYTIQSWNPALVPVISAFSPTNGSVGTAVVITGTNFTGATTVAFNGVAASFTVNSATQITATVPAGAETGLISITTSGGIAQSAASFTIQSPSANLPIYVDSLLNGFQDYSWATSVNDYNTSPVYAGSYSISVTAAADTALSLYHTNFNTAPYASLSFWINGGAAGAQGLQVMGVTNQAYATIYNLPALAANTWTQFNIPLSALGVANVTNCQGFWFWPTLSGATTFYVDSIQLNMAMGPSLTVVSAKPGSGSLVLQLSGFSGQSYWIETSTNLVNWITISTNVLTYSSVNITNTVNGNSSHQYWRAYWP